MNLRSRLRSPARPISVEERPRGSDATGNPLRIPNVRLYLFGQSLSNIGTFFQILALSLLVLHLTGSGFALGATLSLGAVPFLTVGPWAGVIIDRVQIRILLMVTSTLACAQALAIGLLISSGHINLGWIMLLTFVGGCVQIFDRPAGQAFLGELAPRERLPSAIALASAAQSVGRLGGPAIAALVYASLGAAWCFYINSASFLAVVTAVALLRRSEMIPRRHHSESGGFRAGLRFIARSPMHRSVLLSNAVIGCFAFNYPLFYSSIVIKDFHTGSLAFGVAESLNAITAVLSGLWLTRSLRTPSRRGFVLACFGLGVSLAWSALSPTLGIFFAGMLYFGVAVVIYSTVSQSLIQQNTPLEMIGRVMSFYTLGIMGTTPVGGLVAGWVIDAIDPRAAIGLGAASLFACGVSVLLRSRWEVVRPA